MEHILLPYPFVPREYLKTSFFRPTDIDFLKCIIYLFWNNLFENFKVFKSCILAMAEGYIIGMMQNKAKNRFPACFHQYIFDARPSLKNLYDLFWPSGPKCAIGVCFCFILQHTYKVTFNCYVSWCHLSLFLLQFSRLWAQNLRVLYCTILSQHNGAL